uniref:CCHC-type domain-containing protein n=1 Tax=Tanacetum cinerariifolium TaxID=118510 RepID=A0A6L2K7H0_TANCI|nr:hypothetical protein [Tanacetum cinerariifolium]
MANLSEDIQCADSDTRPPMLDRTDFASWQQRIRLHCQGKENGVNFLKSIDKGPFQMGTVREPLAEGTEGAPHLGPECPRMLLEGSELTKEDQESQMYDDFEHYRQHKGETIHDYYIWFTKLINERRNIKMAMSRMQLNSKFVNNMLPEWGRFVTAVKLNKGLRDSNYDQLYAYLKQHETHANENKMMLDRFSQHTVDPLPLMSNVSHQQHYLQSSSTPPSTYVPPHLADNAHLDSNLSPTDNLIENLTNTLTLLTHSYKTLPPQTNNQLRTSSNTRNQATVQDGRVVVQNVQGRQNRGQGINPRGRGGAGYGEIENRVRNTNPGQARQVKCYNCNGIGHIARNCTQPKHPQNFNYYKDKMLQAQENGVALDVEQLLFLAGGHDNDIDEDVDEQPAPTAQTMFMANLSSADHVNDKAGPSYDSDILSEVHDHDHYQDVACKHHEEHVMHDNLQLNHVVDSHVDYTEFDKTCKKRITPTMLIEGERGFEQAKECYLKEVIPFFKTLKENFKGIQKALTKEIKEMKDVFEELEAEVAQNVVNRKLDEIERKNLLIANDKLIAECLTKEVFSVVTNSELNVASFIEMHVANTIVETRYLELEAELSNLRNKSHNDNHDELVNRFSNLERYQTIKKANLPFARACSDTDRTLKVTAVDSHITRLTKKVTVLQAQNDSFRAENDKIKQHYKELYDSIKIMRAKHIDQVTALTTKNVNLKAQILDTVNSVSKEHVKPKVLAPGKYAIDVEPIVPRLRNNREAHLDYLRHLKECNNRQFLEL